MEIFEINLESAFSADAVCVWCGAHITDAETPRHGEGKCVPKGTPIDWDSILHGGNLKMKTNTKTLIKNTRQTTSVLKKR